MTRSNGLGQSGSQTAADDLRIYSHALGTALSAPYPAPGMTGSGPDN